VCAASADVGVTVPDAATTAGVATAADRTERRETPEGDMARSLVAVVGRYVARMLSNAELLPVHCVRIETGRRCRRRVSPTVGPGPTVGRNTGSGGRNTGSGGRNTGSGGRNTGSGGRGALRAPRPP